LRRREATLGAVGTARTGSVGPQEGVNPGSTPRTGALDQP
jgi:hypothetical protein